MKTKIDDLIHAYQSKQVNRRKFLSSLAVLAASGYGLGGSNKILAAENSPPIPVAAFNHMTMSVSDPAASLEWYQGLFGLPIAARQANTIVLQLGDGPQFIAIGGGASDNPRITHYCFSVDDFDDAEAIRILEEHGVANSGGAGAMESRIRMRGADFGGHADGTPELYFGDPDGIMVQLQDSTYCGGEGLIGEICLSEPEPAPVEGLLSIREFNHFTLFVEDQQRAVAFYQGLFGLPIDTYQGAMPVLRVGNGREFLALAEVPPLAGRIHHASFNVDDFDVDRIFSVLEDYGLEVLGEAGGASGPLQAYVTMRGADRGGAPDGTPEVYFTDPDGILLQLQDASYCGGAGYLGEVCGTVANPTGRNA
ncbi:MAG: VOC family protein [Gammaproteobacteria bacterium]|nr:VOC family protein [Gammaproteobacteria bacterium]